MPEYCVTFCWQKSSNCVSKFLFVVFLKTEVYRRKDFLKKQTFFALDDMKLYAQFKNVFQTSESNIIILVVCLRVVCLISLAIAFSL